MTQLRVQGLFGAQGRVFGRLVFGPSMEGTIAAARRASESPLPVLITGESGVGKELVAEAIHGAGPLSRGPFVPLNCGGLPNGLVESELFGHVRGAYTSAEGSRPGAFVAAEGGTVFLDEVGELSLSTQATLLRALETSRVRPVGSEYERRFDARVIAATNRDLDELVAASVFRADLVYRLDVLRVHVPPLRARAEDIRLLAPAILERQGLRCQITRRGLEALETYAWPGNVRELRNVLMRAAQAGGPIIDRTHVLDALERRNPESSLPGATLKASVHAHASELFTSSEGNARRAAQLLGVPRSTFYRWLKTGQVRTLRMAGGG